MNIKRVGEESMRKLLVVVFILLALAASLVGCQGTSGEPKCGKASVLCVGLVTNAGGRVDDKSFNQAAWEAVQQAEKELGARIKYVETTDSEDYDKNIGQFGDAKYDVIVTVGVTLGEATQAAGAKYPDVKFIGVDQFQAPGTKVANVVGLIYQEDHSGFLAGALAAMMTESNKIGAVLGTDAMPPVWRYGEGYRAGAKYINPDIEVTTVYHNDVGFDKTFADPEWGKTTAISMIDKGVDIVFGAGGKTGNGALFGAAEKGAMAIGVITDQYHTVPEAQKVLLTSAIKLHTPGTYGLIKMVKDGNFPAGGNYLGKVGLAPYHDLESKVPAEATAKVEEIANALKSGSLQTNVTPVKPK
jgi:basic membrane protein A